MDLSISILTQIGELMKNPETVRKVVEAGKVTRAKNPEKYRAISIINALKGAQANIGKKRSQETKAKMSAASIGHVCSEATKESVRKAQTGKIESIETRRKKSETHKRMIIDQNIDMGAFTRGKKRLNSTTKMKRIACLCGRHIGANWIRRHEKQCKHKISQL